MAKTKAKKVKKKVSTYDDKLIKIIAISLAVVVVAIVAVVAVFAYNDSYIGKVGGKRIMTYEYELFLGSTMEEMESDARKAFEEAHEDDEDAKFDAKGFWTAEKIAEAKEKALEDVREWKAEYLIAVSKGHGMSKRERNEYAASVESNLYYMWYLQYQSYYSSFNSFVNAYLGNMSLSEYQKFALQDKCIADYRAALEKEYSPTESQLREKYDADPGVYRKVTMLTFAIEKPEKPKEVEEPEEPKEPNTSDKSSAEWIAYEADKAKYEKDQEKYEKYLKEKEDYDKEVAELQEKVEKIFEELKETGKYTGKGITEVASGSDSKDKKIQDYKDATIEKLAETEGALFASAKGTYDFTKSSETEDLIIDDYALSLDWESSARDKITTSLEDDEEDEFENSFATTSRKDDDGNVKTDLILLQDEYYFYITQCTGIKDFDTSIESTEKETSVRDNVKTALLSDMSEEDLKEQVKTAGSKYAVKSKHQKVIDSIVSKVFG